MFRHGNAVGEEWIENGRRKRCVARWPMFHSDPKVRGVLCYGVAIEDVGAANGAGADPPAAHQESDVKPKPMPKPMPMPPKGSGRKK